MAAPRDKLGRPIVVVTGMGVATSLGAGKSDNWKKLTAGESGIRTVTRFPIEGLKTTMAGTVDFVPVEPFSSTDLSERLADLVVEEANAQAGIGSGGEFPGPLVCSNAPIVVGMKTPGHRRFLSGSIVDHLAELFGTKGSPISLSTACASGATAIQLGVEAIRRGETDAALCAGTEASVNQEGLVRFSLLSALSTANDPPAGAAKPFSKNRQGFVLAEGAAALVLEDYDHAVARGAKALGVLEGCGEKSDSFHRARSSPDGKPIIACMRNALVDAGVGPEDVDYINAHGTSTPENDKMEHLGVSTVFGEHIRGIPISSNKSMIGHTLTAAGAGEGVFSFLTLEHQRIPPTINHQVPDPAIALDVVPNAARDARVRRAISNSFGFGGQNVCLVMTREPA